MDTLRRSQRRSGRFTTITNLGVCTLQRKSRNPRGEPPKKAPKSLERGKRSVVGCCRCGSLRVSGSLSRRESGQWRALASGDHAKRRFRTLSMKPAETATQQLLPRGLERQKHWATLFPVWPIDNYVLCNRVLNYAFLLCIRAWNFRCSSRGITSPIPLAIPAMMWAYQTRSRQS